MINYYYKSLSHNFWKICRIWFNILGFISAVISFLIIFNVNLIKYTSLIFSINITLVIVLVGSFIIAYVYVIKKQISYTITGTNIKISICIGDIFDSEGDRVITTNTTFDTTMEQDFISEKSLQGQLQVREFKNRLSDLDSIIESDLEDITPVNSYSRKKSKNNEYEIGTIANVQIRNTRNYLLALSKVNKNGKPIEAKYENILVALESLWIYLGDKGRMETLNIPLVGTGRTGISEATRQEIIKDIILSFTAASMEAKFTDHLVIYINSSDIYKNSDNVDLKEIEEFLKYITKYRYRNKNGAINGIAISDSKI